MTRPLLERGDVVGVTAPGFAVRGDALAAGVERLRSMGFEVVCGRHVLARDGYLAGDDDARAEDLRAMLVDDDVRAVWFARGGYGTARILDRVPWRILKRRPKPLIGYSDLTALFAATIRRCGGVCLHAPMVVELGDRAAYHGPSLRAALAGRAIAMRLRERQILVPGRARGRLIGGNLTVLTHLLGTRFAPDPTGAVLFVEEVGEEAYRIDRMLEHLRQAGVLRRVAAVLVGHCAVSPARRRFPPDRSLEAILGDSLGPLGVPVVTGIPAGHRPGKWTLPLGGEARVDTGARTLRFAP